MKFAFLLLTVLFMFSQPIFGKENYKKPNKSNDFGKREGYWFLDENNDPVSSTSRTKVSEGKYINGRKEGVWIYYYKGGKSPRLVGEYSDNRPSGSYFRFNKEGKMFIASANRYSLRKTNHVASSNQVFSCELNFQNQEIVAGQVFFTNQLFRNNSYRFWVTKSFETSAYKSSVIDFSWLHNNYNSIYASYLEARTMTAKYDPIVNVEQAPVKKAPKSTIEGSNTAPPMVKNPMVADGLEFKRNGWNKLYTKTDEIWMDGYFIDGQLQDGKVFAYDQDGVLLKVRVYKKGEYYSEGGL